MGWGDLKTLTACTLIIFGSQIRAQGISLTQYTVTSKSITVQWSLYSGASSYKITAIPKTAGLPSFVEFGGNTVLGTVNGLSPNTIYTIEAEAMNASRTVLNHAELDVSTAPDVPTIKLATSKQSDSITVEFTDVLGAASYILRAETADGSFFSEAPVAGSPGTIQGLQPYTTYSVSVLSVNSAKAQSQPSYPMEAKTVLAAPQLNCSSSSNDSIQLRWEPVGRAVLYTLNVIMAGADSRRRLNTTASSLELGQLEAGTSYCITVYAWDPENRPGDQATVCQITRPSKPRVLDMIAMWGEVPNLLVMWNMSQGVQMCQVVSSSGLRCTSNSSSCSISPIRCGETHSITLTAYNQAGPSVPSDPSEFISFPCPPNPVWVLEPQPGNCSVEWANVSGAEYYTTFVKSDDGVEETCNNTRTSCRYRCLCGYTYVITVFAHNRAGISPPGPVFNYTTLPCCPGNVFISLVSMDTLEIVWSAVRGADLYETRAVDQSAVILCNDTAPACALSDLTCNSRYSVVVTPCSDLRGCNRTCQPQTHETAPCMPEIQNVSRTNNSGVSVTWRDNNNAANYTVSLLGQSDTRTCQSSGTSCQVSQLSCGNTYEVSVIAMTTGGFSLPSYTVPLETAPCCPVSLTVSQVTQSMSNVSWSSAQGAHTFLTSLSSPRGQARCHTQDRHCLMGCITCGTNYSVSMEAVSLTGYKAVCTYQGFSSSDCCPSGVRLYRAANNTLRIYWRSSSSQRPLVVDVYGSTANYTCTSAPTGNSCDVAEITCGNVYAVVVAPVYPDGTKVSFCPLRMYSVSCLGNILGTVIYRGRRSVD
ncbi:fibronectin type III domain-containing protein 7-like [Denticeps clupeoides]|uniref:Fibronectin type-III domain-containing protein n=1 Tax=Denticeps clupeoides TaxID=299321 RepID=A0AAY4CGZ4_9TELE|nr:fibronectin type III domain-containing protein 7-like [Denticeps clupeoides]